MIRLICCLTLAAAFHAAVAADERFDGTWDVVAAELDGKAIKNFNFAGMQWKFNGELIQIEPANVSPAGVAKKLPLFCSFELNDERTPNHFNWVLLDPTDTGRDKTVKAIYEIEKDKLRISFTVRDGTTRPQSFDTSIAATTTYTLKRRKADSGVDAEGKK